LSKWIISAIAHPHIVELKGVVTLLDEKGFPLSVPLHSSPLLPRASNFLTLSLNLCVSSGSSGQPQP